MLICICTGVKMVQKNQNHDVTWQNEDNSHCGARRAQVKHLVFALKGCCAKVRQAIKVLNWRSKLLDFIPWTLLLRPVSFGCRCHSPSFRLKSAKKSPERRDLHKSWSCKCSCIVKVSVTWNMFLLRHASLKLLAGQWINVITLP